jgi:hypothetical protein
MKLKRILFISTVALATLLLIAACSGLGVLAPLAQSMIDTDAAPAAAPVEEAAAEPTVAPVAEPAADWVAPSGALLSVPVSESPTLDGVADEDFWAEAVEILIPVEDGENMGESEVSLKSVYTEDMVYFLMTWTDPTESFLRSPWEKQADGSWMILKDANDKGGDNNVYYEDKMAIIWTINNSIPNFESKGCFTACHLSKRGDPKPYGNKFTDEGKGDMWHWKSVRNLNQIDDQYLDSTPYSPETVNAGRKSDPRDGGGYADNWTEDKSMPMWMAPEGSPRDGFPGFILDSEKVAFDDSLFVAGDMVPSIVISEFTGDRGNLSAGWKWADGMWTMEIGRALVTDSEFDVQFDDLSAPYYFGVAVFDNAQVRHAYQTDVSVLIFQP